MFVWHKIFLYNIYYFNLILSIMIKCEVSMCAAISRSAVVKKDKDDNSFVSFSVKMPISGRDKEKLDLEISVTTDGGKEIAAIYTSGRRVEITGTLTIRKKDGKMYLNLRTDNDNLKLGKSTYGDKLEGTMTFRGKIGKNGVEEKKDKKDALFKTFSAFSLDRNGDKSDFTWVRFLYFDPKEGEDFLQAGSYIEATGELQLGVYKNALSLDCRLKEVSHWEKSK